MTFPSARDSREALPILALGLVLGLAACAGGNSGSGGGGGGGGGGPVVPPPAGTPEPPFLPGLIAAAGGPGEVRVDWTAPGPGVDVALFRSTVRADVYSGAPVAENPGGTSLIVGGLTNGVVQYFGLGVRASGAPSYEPTGTLLSALPGNPVYVDAAASPAGADGTSPASAFPDLRSGVLVALGADGIVWVRDGAYSETGSLPVLAGVHVYGGFGPAFDLATRDAGSEATQLSGSANLPVVAIQGGEPAAVLDGLTILGGASSSIGVDVTEAAVELRSTDVRNCTDRGIRIRNLSTDCYDVTLSGSSSQGNGADGLSANGALDVFIDGSSFDANVQEGLDLDDLVALEGETARLRVSGSRFFGNGAQGLDVDLARPATLGPMGGFYSVQITGSRFERNSNEGLLIDFDYELTPGWTGSYEVVGCLARANGEHGIRIDADAPGDILVHGTVATANALDGLWVSSESDAGIVVVSASVFSGNLVAGLRASLGNRAVAATHCIFAGNLVQGFVSQTIESSATSSIAYLQPVPWQGVRTDSCVEVTDPLAGTFVNSPEQYEQVLAQSQEALTLSAGASVPLGRTAEVADDGAAFQVVQSNGSSLTLDAVPTAFATPGLLAVFGPSASVVEDYVLPGGSPAEGSGMTPPGGPIVDAGAWGSPAATTPGFASEVPPDLLRPVQTSPPPSTAVGAAQTIDVTFSADLDVASVVTDQVRAVTGTGAEIPIMFQPLGDRIAITPTTDWGSAPFVIQLHADLRSQAGTTLSTPVALAFTPQ